MAQVTWRASDELVERARAVAAERKQSMNELITHLVESPTDPELAGSDWERTRERLRRAGLLDEPGPAPPHEPIDPDELAAAMVEAGRGVPLSDFVSEGRGPR